MSSLSPAAERNVDGRSFSQSRKKKRGGNRVGFVEINASPASVSQGTKEPERQQPNQSNPAAAAVPSYNTIVVLKVKMYCPGCAKEVTKTLSRVNGVTDVHADLQNERVTVKGTAAMETQKLCERVMRRTGKKCEVLLAQAMEEQSGQAVTNLKQAEAVQTTADEVKDIDQPKQQLQDYEKMIEMNELHNQIKKFLQYIAYNKRAAAPQIEYEELSYGDHEVVEPQAIFSDENPNACCIQ